MPISPPAPPPLGASLQADGVSVRVWAPKASQCALVMDDQLIPMTAEPDHHFVALARGAGVGSRYGFRLGYEQGGWGPIFPDPHSRSQPDGVHGLSEVIDPTSYAWRDIDWSARSSPLIPLDRLVFYELHVGTFTPEGTFAAAQRRLPYLKELGITAVELMPVHAFPGRFNWGYDPAAYFAVPASYGSADDLRRLIDEAHALGLAVFIDVVLNHLGPDGAYVNAFAPMLTRASTPWGSAMNLDGEHRKGVRRFLTEAALVWLTEFHADGLRLDATSRLFDASETHFLAALSRTVEALPGPRRLLVAEDLLNQAIVTRPREEGGYGMHSQWVDDLPMMVRLIAGDHHPYHALFTGASAHTVAVALRDGWWHRGGNAHRRDALDGAGPHGPLTRVTHYIDDHDQCGNRPHGEPFAAIARGALFRALSAMLLFAPQLPLLWMGQEWGCETPFPFFADHKGHLAASVRNGRRRTHEVQWRFSGEARDPADPATFVAAKLDWTAAESPQARATRALYQRLLALRPSLVDDPAPWHVEALSEHALHLQQGRWRMLLALAPDLTLDDPGGSLEFSSEDAAYALDGVPPTRRDGRIHFARPAALLLRHDAS